MTLLTGLCWWHFNSLLVTLPTVAFRARVQGTVSGLGLLKETKMFLSHPRVNVSIVGTLCDREVACSASDRQGSNVESCIWKTVSSHSSHYPQEVLLAQFSLYVHKGGLKPDSFHSIYYWLGSPGDISIHCWWLYWLGSPGDMSMAQCHAGDTTDWALLVTFQFTAGDTTDWVLLETLQCAAGDTRLLTGFSWWHFNSLLVTQLTGLSWWHFNSLLVTLLTGFSWWHFNSLLVTLLTGFSWWHFNSLLVTLLTGFSWWHFNSLLVTLLTGFSWWHFNSLLVTLLTGLSWWHFNSLLVTLLTGFYWWHFSALLVTPPDSISLVEYQNRGQLLRLFTFVTSQLTDKLLLRAISHKGCI